VKVEALAIPDVKLVTPQKFGDARGFFSETWQQERFAAAGIPGPFIQDNHALSTQRGVLRGLHLQVPPSGQGKLVRVVRGAIWDVAVDVRHGSPSFGKCGVECGELAAIVGAGRVPARLLHADRGDRGDLQGLRPL
jgi:dTDP-4-dehydrorhamnose 3,5-epimerase